MNLNDITLHLKVLGIEELNPEKLTFKIAKNVYRKNALNVHPDKIGSESTEAFQQLVNAYKEVLKYIFENPKYEVTENNDEEEIFAHENFENFNFPQENDGSYTVLIQNSQADAWQEALENIYGEPEVKRTPKGTECDRYWKIKFSVENFQIEITVHLYNKPKSKKKSKILVQGGLQSAIGIFVFEELPKA